MKELLGKLHVDELQDKVNRRLLYYYYGLIGRDRSKSMVQLDLNTAKRTYGSYSDVKVHHFLKENEVELKSARHLPEDEANSIKPFAIRYDAVILEATNPNFSFRYNLPFDDQFRAIYEPKITFEMLGVAKKYLPIPRKLKGTIAYLANTLTNHFGHWLQCQLPLLVAYWQVFDKESIDYYYVGDINPSDFQWESLSALGIRREQVITYPCQGDRSLIAIKYKETDWSKSQSGLNMDYLSYKFIRGIFTPQAEKTVGLPKKIYVRRGNVKVRRVINEDKVLEYLHSIGFTDMSMDGKSMQDESDLFSQVEVVIAPHGSALHNLIHANPGTKVIEIFPHGLTDSCNYVIANYSQCDYYYCIGDPTPSSGIDKDGALYKQSKMDIKVNIKRLQEVCKLAGLV
jgi:hypothetical protein